MYIYIRVCSCLCQTERQKFFGNSLAHPRGKRRRSGGGDGGLAGTKAYFKLAENRGLYAVMLGAPPM